MKSWNSVCYQFVICCISTDERSEKNVFPFVQDKHSGSRVIASQRENVREFY